MSSSDIAVRVRGLSKAYTIAHQAEKLTTAREVMMHRLRNPFYRPQTETFWALNDISFDINKGDVVGIIGRNGAGKSTLLKILSRITEPTTGQIDLYGRVGSLLEVGTGFHPELTGRENIYLNGAILGMTRREIAKQFDAIVDFSGTEQFLDTPVKRYSSGMYVRLAFAVAAHLNPEILIVDEVLAVGDFDFQQKCLGKMQEVASSGRTVLFVSHNMAAVRHLCAKCAVLHQGEIRLMGDTNQAINMYAGQINGTDVPITHFITKSHPSVHVDEISINGCSNHQITLGSYEKTLEVLVEGTLAEDLRIDLEVWLTDMFDNTLAFYGAGHEHGITLARSSGKFCIRRKLALPECMNLGDYLLNISLTDHNVTSWVECSRSVHLYIEGVPTATGKPLEYKDKKGFVRLREMITM